MILLTHGHLDHIGAVPQLLSLYRVPVAAGYEEEEMLLNPSLNMTVRTGHPVSVRTDRPLADGDHLTLPGLRIRVIRTPGHSKGSVCFYCPEEGVLFSGDTLFRGSFGRTDLYGGSMKAIRRSILEKLFDLPEGTCVYPGHGEETTVGEEKRHNPIYYC